MVELLLSGARPAPGVSADEVLEHARAVYFENPWLREDLPSLLGFDGAGRLQGFVGVVPRLMRYREETVLVAVPGNFVVRQEEGGKSNPFAAMALMKRFLSGPQDLSITDTANDLSRRLWEAAGGVVAGLYSLDWFRPIRPARAILQMMETARRVALPRPLHAAARAADLAGAPMLARLAGPKAMPSELEPFDPDFALELIQRSSRHYELTSADTPDQFRWLCRMVDAKAAGRPLRQAIVRDGGNRIGVFTYLLDGSGIAEVLLAVARNERFPALLRAMAADAAAHGASLLTGMIDPRQLSAYKGQRCFMMCNQWTIIHARRPELVDAFLHGRTLFSGFDGERWTRFGDLYGL